MKIYKEGVACLDCVTDIANGYLPEKVLRKWRKHLPYLVNASEYDELGNNISESEFSTRPCELCGSKLAGYRDGFAILTT